MRILKGGNFFLVNKFLRAQNVVKDPAQYKFGTACRYHLYLVTKNIIKAYVEVVGDFFSFLQI